MEEISGQLYTYKKEIFDFLRTVTIKFDYFAYLMGETFMSEHGLDDPHGEWNPYYLNLSGEYAPNDQRMTVFSVEKGIHVPFDKDLITAYPKTASIYKVPNTEYRILEEKYPLNRGIIRSIAYPVGDIKDIISAPNFTLLGYDDSLLQSNERESIVHTLKEFLNMVRVRWWIPEYTYENMFAVTFWAMLWNHLPNLLLTQRMKNIKTPYVHMYHVWEYLRSRGLGDYRDVLSLKQSLWLYRNIDYIQKNEGKDNNLVILAENLLTEIYVSLLHKKMYQETHTAWDIPRFNPRFKSYNIITGVEEKDESFDDLNDRLVASSLEYENSADFVYKKETELGTQNHNILSTKYLEFKKNPINTRNQRLMVKFFLDTLIYNFTENRLSFTVSVKDPTTGSSHKLAISDAIVLWYYSLMKSVNEEPVYLPTMYHSDIAFKTEQPSLSDIELSVFKNGAEYNIRTLIDLDTMMTSLQWGTYPFTSHQDFMDYLIAQFRTVLLFHKSIENSNKFMYKEGMKSFYRDTTVKQWLDVDLSESDPQDLVLMQEWITRNPSINTIVGNHQDATFETWENLAINLFDAIFPLPISVTEEFIGSTRNLEKVYTSIRDLFIQLGSYNITYLETERDEKEYLFMYDLDFHEQSVELRNDGLWHLVISMLNFKGDITQYLTLEDLVVEFNMHLNKFENGIADHKWNIYTAFKEVMTWKRDYDLKKQLFIADKQISQISGNNKALTSVVSFKPINPLP